MPLVSSVEPSVGFSEIHYTLATIVFRPFLSYTTAGESWHQVVLLPVPFFKKKLYENGGILGFFLVEV